MGLVCHELTRNTHGQLLLVLSLMLILRIVVIGGFPLKTAVSISFLRRKGRYVPTIVKT